MWENGLATAECDFTEREKQRGLAFVRVNLKKAILFNFSVVKSLNSSEEVEPWFEGNGAQVFRSESATFFFVRLFSFKK